MKFSPKSILKMITAGPVRYKAIVPAWDKPKRAKLRKIFDDLLAQGTIKQVYIDRFPHYVLSTWERTDNQVMAALEDRARRTRDGCLLWAEHIHKVAGPLTSIYGRDDRQPVWRIVWRIKHGELGYTDTVRPACGNANCIEWRHLRKMTRAEVQKGRPKAPMHAMRVAKAAQENASVLNWDKVRELRASKEPASVFAKRWGGSVNTMTAARRGETWKEPRDTGMFSGLINERRA